VAMCFNLVLPDTGIGFLTVAPFHAVKGTFFITVTGRSQPFRPEGAGEIAMRHYKKTLCINRGLIDV
ncbi:hypothetical protein VWS90_002239, partial [Cronobacter sakazakii]|nr:hypothetical protein [Cronobacter sakazakii]EJA3085153.1 hypothetical protein [Cronobacter sakazakii]EJA3089232.1 hypothetical protein [Cronobacter sakazakii]EJA3117235.1 hypothetical protein [Cronobacter sakazakii]EJB0281821.1 hypothetical protein [Cronobacter sakazakii]